MKAQSLPLRSLEAGSGKERVVSKGQKEEEGKKTNTDMTMIKAVNGLGEFLIKCLGRRMGTKLWSRTGAGS